MGQTVDRRRIRQYNIHRILFENSHEVLYDAQCEQTQRNICLKTLKPESLKIPVEEALAAEAMLLNELKIAGVPLFVEQLDEGGIPFLVFEKPEGTLVADLVSKSGAPADQSLEIIIALLDLLGRFHQAGWLLLDFEFSKLVWNKNTKSISVLDVSPAVRKAKDGLVAKSPPRSIAYCSPEQTGRSNRRIDERSDVYAAGMIFYHLLTGRYPVEPGDIMHAIHFQMAFALPKIELEEAALSNVLNAVIEKMTAKPQDQRYQSVAGVLFDLRDIQKKIKAGESLASFQLARHDFSSELVLSQSLYGRDRELEGLHHLLQEAENGRLQFVFIKGLPGIGKSSLIKEFMNQIDLDRYLFVSGKYRQLEQNEFLKGVILACEQIIRRKSLGLDTELQTWIARVVAEVGDNWGLLISVLPSLAGLIERPSLQQNSSPAEINARRTDALFRFLKASATPENPLILFLDDIQWFDQGSKDLVFKLASEEASKYIFMICSYRPEEVTDTHEVNMLYKNLKKSGVPYSEISLASIESTDIAALIRDSLSPVAGDVNQFVKLIEGKTGGNPFFVKQLLYHIFDEKILKRNAEFAWTWDTEAIVGLKAASNVIELLESRIDQLPPDIKQLLLRVSCFDGRFNRTQLTRWFSYSDEFLNTALSILEAENYIYSDKESNFFIFHDRIREAAYGLLDAHDKQAVHRTIGEALYKTYSAHQLHETLVRAVGHLSKGMRADDPLEVRVHLAKLNLQVGLYAKNLSAYDVAFHHAQKGLEALGSHTKGTNIELYFSLQAIVAECLFLKGRLSEASPLFEELIKINVSTELKAQLYIDYMPILHAQNKYAEVAELGREALRLFGIHFPEKVTKLHLLWNILKVELNLKRVGIDNLPHVPRATDPKVYLIQRIYMQLGGSAYFHDKNTFGLTTMKIMLSFLKHGTHPAAASIGIFYATMMAHKFNKYERSYKIAKKIEELRIRLNGIPYGDRGNFTVAGMLQPYVEPLSVAKQSMEKVQVQMKRLGDPIMFQSSILYLCHLRLDSAEPLAEVLAESIKGVQEIRRIGDKTIEDSTTSNIINCARLIGLDVDTVLKDESFEAYKMRLIQSPILNPRTWFGYGTMIVGTLLRSRADIVESLEFAKFAEEGVPYVFCRSTFTLFSALHYFEEAQANPADAKRYLALIKPIRKKIKVWRRVNPVTFDPYWHLFEAAEQTYLNNEDKATAAYVESIETSVRSENLMFIALSNERLGRYLLARGKNNLAYRCLGSAMNAYDQWGAAAKVDQMKNEFPALMVIRQAHARPAGDIQNENLDVLSVVKSCQILGNERDISKLLNQIVFLLIENAGAEKGHIFLKTDEKIVLRATSNGTRPEDVVIVSRPLESVEDVSVTLVKHVVRTLETMIIDNAQTNDLIRNDIYVRMAGSKSILCMPIINKGQLIGVIWLENNKTIEAFDMQRASVLEILASQAAISFENARLFDQEQEKIRMEGELQVAQTVQNTLFEVADGAIAKFKISGSIEPASECGGDWWHYGSFKHLNYFCIGDATGHGVSAALITSAVRSAMATVSFVEDVSAVRIMKILNNAVSQTSKGRINMTMFLAVYNNETKEFSYCNNSHEPTLHIPWKWIEELRAVAKSDKAAALKRFRKELPMLSDVTGTVLGSGNSTEFYSVPYEIGERDYLFCYTDGIPEMYAPNGEMLGERAFMQLLADAFFEESDLAKIRSLFREKLRQFRTTAPLKDDVTFFITQKEA